MPENNEQLPSYLELLEGRIVKIREAWTEFEPEDDEDDERHRELGEQLDRAESLADALKERDADDDEPEVQELGELVRAAAGLAFDAGISDDLSLTK